MDKATKERLGEIREAMKKYGFDKILGQTAKNKILHSNADDDESNPLLDDELPVKLRLMLQDLGTTFIKLGQLMSTRPDMVGEKIANELANLQDDNPAISYEQIKEPMQIKGVVTGNDVEGNIYNQIAIEDGTGAMIICVAQGGMYGQLQVGREILVELQDLYVGSYGQQPEIGTPYTNKNGRTYVSRMPRALWQGHFKILGMKSVSPVEFDKTKLGDGNYMKENCGQLMTIHGVKFQGANGKKVFAADKDKDAANSVNRALQGISSNQLVVRTSTYADFANKPLPQGDVDITGIFTRYNNTWQILIRQESDIVEK